MRFADFAPIVEAQMHLDRPAQASVGKPTRSSVVRADAVFGYCLETDAGIHEIKKASEECFIDVGQVFEGEACRSLLAGDQSRSEIVGETHDLQTDIEHLPSTSKSAKIVLVADGDTKTAVTDVDDLIGLIEELDAGHGSLIEHVTVETSSRPI